MFTWQQKNNFQLAEKFDRALSSHGTVQHFALFTWNFQFSYS